MNFIVTYTIISEGREHKCEMPIEADSASEACKLAGDIIEEETGQAAHEVKAILAMCAGAE